MNANVRMPMDARAVSDIDDAELEVAVCRTLPDIMQAMAVRSLVYMGEQACPYDEEYDGNDFAGTTHLVLRRNGEPIDRDNPEGEWAVRVYYKPFVDWIWGGCLLMAFGGLLAMLDRRYRVKARTSSSVKTPAGTQQA